MRIALLAFLCACTREQPPAPRPVVRPSPDASVPNPAPTKPVAIAPCTEAERIVSADAGDVAWTKRITDEMLKGISVKRLVCMFGVPVKPNGDFLEMKPYAPSFVGAIAGLPTEDRPEVSIEVRYAKKSGPLVASVEKLLGTSEDTMRIHFDSPHVRIIYRPAPEDVSIRALLTLDPDDLTRIAELRLDVSDLRGWKVPVIRCWDGAHVMVRPPSGDRFPKGAWSFDVRAAGKSLQKFDCDVPADILDVGRCTPSGREPPGAELPPMATGIELHVPTREQQLELVVTKDGAPFATKQVAMQYSTRPAVNTPTGTCTHASEWIFLR